MATIELAAAVSTIGGLGSLALTWVDPIRAATLVSKLKQLTARPFIVNFVLAFPCKALDACLEAGAPVVTFSWGQPGELVKRAHSAGAVVGVQIATKDGARAALDSGADFVICQGIEAGGHVQSSLPLSTLLAEVVPVAADRAVVAAGGLCTGRQISAALAAGADAVMLGTRFVASLESRAHPLYKQALVEAAADQAVMTTCFDGGWKGASHRVLRNSTLTAWESFGSPPPGRRPGEGQILATSATGERVRRYDDTPPSTDMEGDILGCCLYAGLGCGAINDIPGAADLVQRLWQECVAESSNAA